MRYGESICPSNSAFDHKLRLNRASVSITRAPKGSKQKDVMTKNPGRFKSMNKHAGRPLVGEVDHDDPLNWPAAIIRLMRNDVITFNE